MRRFYILLLRLHPRTFRQRFGDEMLAIFDESPTKSSLLSDALRSLFRQWALRPRVASFSQASFSRTAAVDGVPLFYSTEPEIPSAKALMRGALVAILAFGVFSMFIAHRWKRADLIVGSHHPSPSHILAAHTDAIAETDLPSEVKVQPYPGHPPISPYFALILVLSALDADHDNIISAAEIENAPAALRTLDRDHDGKLTAEECGLKLGPNTDPVMRVRARQMFMIVHPVLAALDTDHDGVISESEIRNSARALRTLDVNRDGRLTEPELVPDRDVMMAANLLLALDRDGDGRISQRERSGPVAERFRDLLDRADGGKGFITGQDLVDAMGRRH